MTGTGTKTDPYIVDSWADFVQAVAIENTYVKFADGGGTIDMNDICPEGITETVTINAVVDGNGWNIKNLYADRVVAFLACNSIYRLNFIDFYITSDSQYSPAALVQISNNLNITIGILNQCRLSGITAGAKACVVRGRNTDLLPCVFSRCSVNLKTLSGGMFDGNYYVPCGNCIFEIDDSAGTVDHHVFNHPIFYDCLIMGKYQKLSIGSESKNVIIDAECQNVVTSNATTKTRCFIGNNDKAEFDDSFHSVTTEQLKNAAYLASLGFPIGVD